MLLKLECFRLQYRDRDWAKLSLILVRYIGNWHLLSSFIFLWLWYTRSDFSQRARGTNWFQFLTKMLGCCVRMCSVRIHTFERDTWLHLAVKTIEDCTCNLSPLLYKSAVSALDKGQTSDKDSGQTWGNDQWNFFESRSACCDFSLQIPSSCETKGKRQEADSGQQSSCLLSVSFRHILPYFPFSQLQSWKPYL